VTIQTTVSPLGADAQADTRAVLLHQVSWGAIFAGAAIALVAQAVINLIGVGVGLASVGVNASDNPAASTVSAGAGIWFVVSGIVASLIGGLISGRLSGKPIPGTAGLHGLVSWSVTTLVVLYLLTSAASGIVGGTLSTVSGALGGAGSLVGGTVQTAAQAAAPSLSKISNPLDGIEQKVREQAAGRVRLPPSPPSPPRPKAPSTLPSPSSSAPWPRSSAAASVPRSPRPFSAPTTPVAPDPLHRLPLRGGGHT